MLTDKSVIPLKPSDFRVLEGERRLSDVRLAERLGFEDLQQIRNLTERHQPFLESKSGKPMHRAWVSRSRGPTGHGFWYTVPELIFIAGQSKAKNAPDVQYEAALIAAYFVQGEQPPADAAPTIRALAAPDKPTIIRGDDNIGHIIHEKLPQEEELEEDTPQEPDECERREQLRDQERDRRTETRLRQIGIDGIQGRLDFGEVPFGRIHPYDEFQDQTDNSLRWSDAGFDFVQRCEQGPPFLKITPVGYTDTAALIHTWIPTAPHMQLCTAPNVPSDVMCNAVAHIGKLTPLVEATIKRLFE